MKLIASLGVLLAFLAHSFGQTRPIGDGGVMRMVVRHGDPYLVKALIEGVQVSQPELSTLLGFAGVPDRESELLSTLFGGQGILVVNPTDNSILFFPKKG